MEDHICVAYLSKNSTPFRSFKRANLTQKMRETEIFRMAWGEFYSDQQLKRLNRNYQQFSFVGRFNWGNFEKMSSSLTKRKSSVTAKKQFFTDFTKFFLVFFCFSILYFSSIVRSITFWQHKCSMNYADSDSKYLQWKWPYETLNIFFNEFWGRHYRTKRSLQGNLKSVTSTQPIKKIQSRSFSVW